MPNSFLAAAEGMPDVNRRRLLNLTGAGLALAATAASVRNASATLVAQDAEHPDAELLALDKEMEEAHSRMETASESNSALSDKIEALLPPRPLHPTDWKSRPMPAHLKQLWDEALKNVLFVDAAKGDWQPEPVSAWHDANDREKAQIQAAWEEWSALRDERYREHNYEAMEEAFNGLSGEEWEIGRRIFAISAHTLEGMAVKIRAGERLGLENLADPSEAYLSIAADIKRLAEGGAA
ncbi:hypothetical protein [Mesorhizobium sp.]|uniref:hypothetical protein n=1 Tax=Mesorhizobium sp. TaxID=1871066 RepID=UPI000FE7574C|nr:hypothetical protein [Mesorhizobium sp.]RWK76261.1 MAG: hypothetical protein EOR50_14800 [Mesorhizobium sp.]RWK81024.1 MAG: hypothetical protein EOR51_16380 [Mesorhizobium sp.]RWL08345.1 MAG: hypothetical protein EOR55_04095 [Mesorhizobium sp.]RWL12144.1 MAG: hypothetical protein EOR56_15045 [Mesorhizobium sp.]